MIIMGFIYNVSQKYLVVINSYRIPTTITSMMQKPNSDTTLFMTFDKGWQLSFRIHNARTVVEPSLKFDINIIGMPQAISRHEIKYLG